MKTQNLLSSLLILLTAWNGLLPDLCAANNPSLVSSTTNSQMAASGSSYAPSYSANGRVMVFLSAANNLVTNDNRGDHLDVFVRDLESGVNHLVSVSASGFGGGNGTSSQPVISSNGQYVAFVSEATNLVANDTNREADIFVRDLRSGITRLVSASLTGGSALPPVYRAFPSYSLSTNPRISADGRKILFASLATNLVSIPDTNNVYDLFLADIDAGTLTCLSLTPVKTATAQSQQTAPPETLPGSYEGEITADGRKVVFLSNATNLLGRQPNFANDLYLYDVESKTNSAFTDDVVQYSPNTSTVLYPVLSADGLCVTFKVASGFPATALVAQRRLESNVITGLFHETSPSTPPSTSSDGRYIAYEVFSGTDARIMRWDTLLRTNEVVSLNINGDASANGTSQTPVISPDGQKVVFLSTATDLSGPGSIPPDRAPQLFMRDMAQTNCLLVAGTVSVGSKTDLSAAVPVWHPDGCSFAFDTTDDTLAPRDINGASDILVFNLQSSVLSRISLPLPTRTGSTYSSSAMLNSGSVSANGQMLAYGIRSGTSPHAWNETREDVCVRDIPNSTELRLALTNGTLISPVLLSRDGRYVAFKTVLYPTSYLIRENLVWIDTLEKQRQEIEVHVGEYYLGRVSSSIALSPDGRFVAFASRLNAPAFVGPIQDSSSSYDIFIRDMATGTNRLITMTKFGTAQMTGSATFPIFSPDSQWILFTSTDRNLATNTPTSFTTNLFAHNLRSNSTHLLSPILSSAASPYNATSPRFTADSRFVFFSVIGKGLNGDAASVYRHDLATKTTVLIDSQANFPVVNADGSLLLLQSRIDYLSNPIDMWVKDIKSGSKKLVTSNNLVSQARSGWYPDAQISPNGRYVIFSTPADNLIPGDTNGFSDVFLCDWRAQTTWLLSVNAAGTGPGNSHSGQAVLSADGRTVFFQSMASDLDPLDFNGRRDIFLVRIAGDDSDADGLDDDWEMAYLGTLSRGGEGDFDQDGSTDRAEFMAGTDPTNSGSILHVFIQSPVDGGSRTLLWQSVPGKTYRVQYKDSVTPGPWTEFPTVITGKLGTASFTDPQPPSASTNRFYRVIVE